MSECITPDKVQEAFLNSPPLVAQQILDLTVKHPNWARDLYEIEEWPRGNGTVMEQLVFKGAMPQIERGFDKWQKIANLSGCNPCEGPDCSYNWTMFGGHGFQRKITELMKREFRSPSYCVSEIQTTAHFMEVFAKIVENLYAQIDFFKEMNIGLNYLTELAKKYVVDCNGPQCNPHNPYVYRNIGTNLLETLGINILEFFYEQMRRMPSAVPYDVVDGAPIYALEASHQLLAHVYRDDPELRQDVRFSGLANDLVSKYNFMSTLRGMFIAAPILYPRRFTIVAGEPVEVLPFVNGVPAEVGSFTENNPDYEDPRVATHEEVLLHGKYPFKVFYMPTETSLGDNSSFGPEFAFMNSWLWINPMTTSDPFRRVGYFATSAKIGLSQQFSEAIFGILVRRPLLATAAFFAPPPMTVPTIPVCATPVADVACPCPMIVSITANPFEADTYTFVFATAIDAVATDPISLQLANGTCVTGEVEDITADGLTLSVSFEYGLTGGQCAQIVGVCCDPVPGCSATVVVASDCRSDQTDGVKLVLSNAIKADTAADIIVAYFGDCTTANLEVVSVDGATLEWVVQYAAGFGPTDDPTGAGATVLSADMICDRGGISKVCVPPATDATCPACGTSLTPCDDDEIG